MIGHPYIKREIAESFVNKRPFFLPLRLVSNMSRTTLNCDERPGRLVRALFTNFILSV
jgi:hypothetical protein